MEDVTERLRAAEADVRDAELSGDEEAADTIAELRGQVGDLLDALKGQEAAVGELMVLRPRLAELEEELGWRRDGLDGPRPRGLPPPDLLDFE